VVVESGVEFAEQLPLSGKENGTRRAGLDMLLKLFRSHRIKLAVEISSHSRVRATATGRLHGYCSRLCHRKAWAEICSRRL